MRESTLFDELPITGRLDAARQAMALYGVACHEAVGLTRTAAVAVVAVRMGVSASTVWRWMEYSAPPSIGWRDVAHAAGYRPDGDRWPLKRPSVARRLASKVAALLRGELA